MDEKQPPMSSNEPKFQCILTNDPEKKSSSENLQWLVQEEGKKSSFVLSLDDDTTPPQVDKPSHLLIQLNTKETFLFGGIELVSNSRNIEIYLTGDDGKETYLTTSRGLLLDNSEKNRFKCIVVCPGGPRPVTRVHFKLLSLKPTSCTGATLYLLKLKGRLPPPEPNDESGATNDATATTRQTATTTSSAANAPPTSPPLTQADMGQAMAGVSLLVRSVETSLLQSMQSSLDKMEQKFDARFNRLEYILLQQQQAQQQQQEQYTLLKQEFMTQLKEQHSETLELMGSLHAQLTADSQHDNGNRERIRQVPEASCDETKSADESAEQEKAKPTDSKSDLVAEQLADATVTTNESPGEQAGDCERREDTVTQDKVNQSEHDNTVAGTEERVEGDPQQDESDNNKDQSQQSDAGESVKEAQKAHDESLSNSVDAEELVDSGVKVSSLDQHGQDGGKDASKDSSAFEPDPLVGDVSAIMGNEAESLIATDEVEETTASSPVSEKRPVMENRTDAVEIPDLLFEEPSATELNQTENENEDNPD